MQQLNAELQAELERATPREVRVPYRQRVAEALLSENRARLEVENALRQLQAEVCGREHGVRDAALARMCTARELQREADAAQEAEIERAINSREAVVAELMAAVAEHREAELASEQHRANKAEAALAEAEAALAEHEADLAGSQAVELVERQAALEQAAELAKQQAVELAERQATELAEHQAGLERQAMELAEREAKLAQLEEALATERADRMRLVQELTDARLSAAPAVSQADRSSVREQIALRFAPQTPAMDPNVLVPESQEEADGREPASSRVIVNESQFVQEAGDETEPPPPTPHQQQSDADDAEAELSQPFATNASIACAYSPSNGFPLGNVPFSNIITLFWNHINTSRASAARALCALFILFSCCLSLLAMATAATPKLTDKGGEEIRIGCRVAEADFSYGDGVVESITVPITGDGFNVGIKWDTPELGGPPWSAEGGGRSAEHLLVLGPPPELLQRSTKWTDWCSRWRAFQRSFVACWASNGSWASGRASFAPLAWYAYRAHVRSSCSAGASPSPPSSAIRRGLCSCCGSADCCPLQQHAQSALPEPHGRVGSF